MERKTRRKRKVKLFLSTISRLLGVNTTATIMLRIVWHFFWQYWHHLCGTTLITSCWRLISSMYISNHKAPSSLIKENSCVKDFIYPNTIFFFVTASEKAIQEHQGMRHLYQGMRYLCQGYLRVGYSPVHAVSPLTSWCYEYYISYVKMVTHIHRLG